MAPTCLDWLIEPKVDNMTSPDLNELNRRAMTRNLGGLAFVSVVMTFGFFGNILVIFIYSCRMKSSNNYTVYILCLGVLDLINCSLTMPFVMVYLIYPLNFPSDALCKAGHFVGYWVGIGSPLILVLISLDRYRRICQPFRRQLSERKARICCGLVLLMSLLFAWPTPILYGNQPVDTGISNITGTRCFKDMDSVFEKFQDSYYIVLTSLATLISLCLFIPYYCIMKKVRNQIIYWKNSKTDSMRGSSRRKAMESRKITRTFFVVTAVYTISTLPHDALALVLHRKTDLECDLGYSLGAVFYTFLFIVFINNIANPIIYAFSDERFYREIKKIVHGQESSERSGSISFPRSSQSSSEKAGNNLNTRQTLEPKVPLQRMW